MVDNLYYASVFDRRLTPGMAVRALWTKDGFAYCGSSAVVKLNRFAATVRVELVWKPNGRRFVGKLLELPRFADQTRWSKRNCVQPMNGQEVM